MNSERFKSGIIDVHTRQFGTVAEIIVMILREYVTSKKLEFDLVDVHDSKVEVKASKVLREQRLSLTIDTFYEVMLVTSNRDRMIARKDVKSFDFDCNMQQIKTTLFDRMVYLLFFNDGIELFEISKKQIQEDKEVGYSDKQHRGNIGEGQFHVSNKTYGHHKKKYFVCSVSYKELMDEAKKRRRKTS